jgi:hypothetical protein
VTEQNLAVGLIYPPQWDILNASLHVAEKRPIAPYVDGSGCPRGSWRIADSAV